MRTYKIIQILIIIIILTLTLIFKIKKNIEEKKRILKESEQWNYMIDLWVDYKLKGPINELITYDSEVQNGGHLQYFENKHGEIEPSIAELKKILPEILYNNLINAYNIYKQQNYKIETVEDFVNAENEEKMLEHDMFYYEKDALVNKILKDYSLTLEIKE